MPIAFPFILAFFISVFRVGPKSGLKPAATGFCLATLPTILYNLRFPGATLLRLFSRPAGLDRTGLMTKLESGELFKLLWEVAASWLQSSYRAVLDVPGFILSLFGLGSQTTAWEQAAGFVTLAIFIFGIWRLIKKNARNSYIAEFCLWTILINLVFVVAFGMNRYRYLIPVLITVPFGLAAGIAGLCKRWQIKARSLMVLVVLLLHLVSNVVRAPGHQFVEGGMIEYLEARGLLKGYANYFIAYQLNYLSNERLIYSPVFHTPSHDRYDPYTEMAAGAEASAFIFEAPTPAGHFRRLLKELNIGAGEDRWNSYTIFYGLDQKVNIDTLRNRYQTLKRNG
jgi:hypothetical protein